MKFVILAGGYGSRLNPATLASNKHLLPVYSRRLDKAVPMIFFPIDTAKRSGVTDILIITSRDHCGQMVQTLGDGHDLGVKISYAIQEMDRKPTGIAQALKLAQPFICDEPFAVCLGDNFYQDSFDKEVKDFKDNYKNGLVTSSIFLKEVHDPERFGVAKVEQEKINSNGVEVLSISEIIEKPENPPSNWAVTGLYFYTPHVFSLLPDLKPSRRGEIEITDVNNWYVKNKIMNAYVLNGFWHDMGTPEGVLSVTDFLDGVS